MYMYVCKESDPVERSLVKRHFCFKVSLLAGFNKYVACEETAALYLHGNV